MHGCHTVRCLLHPAMVILSQSENRIKKDYTSLILNFFFFFFQFQDRQSLEVGHIDIQIDYQTFTSQYKPPLKSYTNRRTPSEPTQDMRRHSHPKNKSQVYNQRALSSIAPQMGGRVQKISKKGPKKRSLTAKEHTVGYEIVKLRKTQEWVDLGQRAIERRTGPRQAHPTGGDLSVSGNHLRLQQRPRVRESGVPQAAYDLRSNTQISGCRPLRRRSDCQHVEA